MTSWPEVPLGEVCEPVERLEQPLPGKMYRQVGVRLWGVGAYEREQLDGAATRYPTLNRVEDGDIIVNKIWARNGSVAVVSPELAGCFCSGEFPTFAPHRGKLEPRWFHWITKTRWFWQKCDEKSRGTSGKNRIRPEQFQAVTIPLPPLPEQQRIVKRIEDLSVKLAEARAFRRSADTESGQLLNSVIHQIFSGGGARGWLQKTLGDYVLDDCYGTSEKTTDDQTGIPILRMGNIQEGRLDFRDLKYLPIAASNRDKFLLRKGDILVNRTNSAELVGKCAVFEADGEYGFASYLIRLRLNTERAVPGLVSYYINSPMGRDYMFRERKQMTGQANVNATKLKALPITLPPSLDEQRQISARLDALRTRVDSLQSRQTDIAVELDALLPAVLDKAFKGEL